MDFALRDTALALADRLVVAAERIADAQDRIAAALATPAVAPAETPTDCPHTEKMKVILGMTDEWECAVARGGCGYRTPALIASGG